MPSASLEPPEPTPASPCIGVCRLGADGLCIGCRRSLDEIARWGSWADEERRRWVREVLPGRPPAAT